MASLCLQPAAAATEAGDGVEVRPGRPSIPDKTAGLRAAEGLIRLHIDDGEGRIHVELPAEASAPEGIEMLYAAGIRSGLGSNPVGLDRSRLGEARLVRFRRVGGKVLLEELNTRYRALTESRSERKAVRDSFASSVLWAGEVEAESEDGGLLIDLTSFLTADVFGFARVLDASGQGSFTLEASRSAVDPDEAFAFPDNLEIDAILTFAGAKPGADVRETAPDPHAVTVTQHHSFVRLPDDGYKSRRFDPRAGSYAIEFMDYAAPLDQPLEKALIVRHRIEKVDPKAQRSKVTRPIVYYVDSGVPEPVRSALVEGAGWWMKAFDAAGFIDAFRVELLPEGVSPLDARYNVVSWVHRSTRGWSYGGGFVDPRTGEMIKGNVLLGSLRVRQDRLLFEGLAGTARTGTGSPDDPVELALARIRQLTAHEVGHALGLAHNFAASAYGRASVMDYPAPLVGIDAAGGLDFSRAYGIGTGAWDFHAIRYAYGEPARGQSEEAYVQDVIRDGLARHLLFITDHDARPAGAAQPVGNLWDNGEDPVAELERLLRIRGIALEAFGEDRVAVGRPLSLLREVFLPVYFHHRYQIAATAKMIGGLDYGYALRGDAHPSERMIDPARQAAALGAILRLLDPSTLDIPESALRLLVPRPFGYPSGRELNEGRTDPAFDALGVARTAARMAVGALLQPERTARLVDFHRRDAHQPGLGWLIGAIVRAAFDGPEPATDRLGALGRVARGAVVDGLIALASDGRVTDEVRAVVDDSLRGLRSRRGEGAAAGGDPHTALLADRIGRYLERRIAEPPGEPATVEPPPGDPIGSMPELAGCSREEPWSI
jgi:hypothetical protein